MKYSVSYKDGFNLKFRFLNSVMDRLRVEMMHMIKYGENGTKINERIEDEMVNPLSFGLLLLQNTSQEQLNERYEMRLDDLGVKVSMVAQELLINSDTYEKLFHEGWDFKDLVEEILVEKNIKL